MMRNPIVLVILLAAAACGDARPTDASKARSCPTWKAEIAPALQPCVTCHEDLATYEGALAMGAKLASIVNPATADATHRPFSDRFARLETWTSEDCELAYVRTSVHEVGLMNPASDGFHGKDVERSGNRLDVCAGCHGADFKGGPVGVSCTTCHQDEGGPTACTTCHGAPPASGAHIAHVTSPNLDKPTSCTECHTVPTVYSAVGHATLADGKADPPPAEIMFGDLARTGGTPSYDASAKSCSGVYCHGASLGDTGATHPQPSWTGGPTHGECGACHGAPPTSAGHPADEECSRCHVNFTPMKHVNGAVDLGIAAAGCEGCHGGPSSPNPLSGAHRSHVEGLHLIAAPIACSACHTVPATLTAAGHIDTPAPAEVMGIAGGSYAAASQTCSNVGCHGAREVTWTQGIEAATCGSCHGIPPVSGVHQPTMTLRDCVNCHSATVDDFGVIKVVNGQSAHINGRLN